MFNFISRYKEEKSNRLANELTCSLGKLILMDSDPNWYYRDVTSIMYRDLKEFADTLGEMLPEMSEVNRVLNICNLKRRKKVFEIKDMPYKFIINYDDGVADTARSIYIE